MVPSILWNPVTTPAAMNNSKIKWSVNERVCVSQIDIFPIGKKVMRLSVGLRCIRRLDVVSMSGRHRSNDVILTMVLKPKSLVYSIVPGVRWVGNIKVNQVTPIHKTGQVKGHSCLEGHTDQTPLANFIGTNRM